MKTRPRIPGFRDVYQIHVALRHIEPIIWRRLHVPAATMLDELHDVLQAAFGWQNSHLHDFAVGDLRFAIDDVDDEIFAIEERGAPLGAIAREGSTFTYRYDYGDDWEHDVLVERILETPTSPALACIAGARACPPEDCGGPPGFERMLKILADPEDEEHADMRRWVGKKYDPEAFDPSRVNRKLAMLAKRLGRRR